MMMGVGVLFIIAIVGLVAVAIGWRLSKGPTHPADKNRTPLEELKARYACGELSLDEYEKVRRDLEASAE